MTAEEESPNPIGDLDLRYVTARIVDDEGDPILVVDDGELQVEFTPGIGGSRAQAIIGAQRIASTALEYAATLRRRPKPE